jgi:hypothetical protein
VSVFTDVFRPLLDLHPEVESELRAYLSARPHGSHGDELLTVWEAAGKWKKNPETIRRWIRENRIPRAEKIGREWRIPVNATVLTAGEARSTQTAPRVDRRSAPIVPRRSSASGAMRRQAQQVRATQTQQRKEVHDERAA